MNLQRPVGWVGGPELGRKSMHTPETRKGARNRSSWPGSRPVWRGMAYNTPIHHLDPTLAPPHIREETPLRQPRSLPHVPSSPQRTMRPRPGPHGPRESFSAAPRPSSRCVGVHACSRLGRFRGFGRTRDEPIPTPRGLAGCPFSLCPRRPHQGCELETPIFPTCHTTHQTQ